MRAARSTDSPDRWYSRVLRGQDIVVSIPEDFKSEGYLRLAAHRKGISCQRISQHTYLLTRKEEDNARPNT